MIRLLVFFVCSIFPSPMHLVFPGPPPSPPLKKLDSYYHRFLLGRLQYPKANRKQWLCIGVLWAMSKWFLLGMNSPVGFRLKRTSQKNNLNFHIDGFLADMSGRSIAAIRHKRSKIQRSWPVLEWVQYELVKAYNAFTKNNGDIPESLKTLPVILNILLWMPEFVCEART